MGIFDKIFGSKRKAEKKEPIESKDEAKIGEGGKVRNIDEYVLAEMIKVCDVKGLSEDFQKAANWDTREWAIVALGNICGSKKAGVDYDKSEMIKTLKDIIEICKAERTGGTYRIACLENAEMLLEKLEGKTKKTATNSEDKPKKVDRAKIRKDLKKISPVQVSDWLKSHGSRFGPLRHDGPNAQWYDIDKTVEFISEVLEGKKIHYPGGKEEIVYDNNYAKAEIYGAGNRLKRRYVIAKDSKSDQYLCYLAWLS